LNIYDEAIEALLNNDPELAIHIINRTQKSVAEYRRKQCNLSLDACQSPGFDDKFEFESVKSTDFLNFHGWEAS
jgi:hypothetical protein